MKPLLGLLLLALISSPRSEGLNSAMIYGGAANNWIGYENEMDGWSDRSSLGGWIGARYSRSLSGWMQLQAGIEGWLAGGAKDFNRWHYLDTGDSTRVKGYFDESICMASFPVGARFTMPRVPVYASLAVTPSWLISAESESKGVDEPLDKVQTKDESDMYDKFNLEGSLELGVEYRNISLFGRFDLGFLDLAKEDKWFSTKKTNSLGAGIGYRFVTW